MRVKLVTFGCSNNLAESEIMCGLLRKAGYEIVETGEDVRIVNVCSVKGPSLNKGLKEAKASKAPVVVAGCIPAESIKAIKKVRDDLSLLSTHNFDKIADIVDKTSKGLFVDVLEKGKKVKVCLPKIRKNPIVNIVPISSGCKGECTYCSVRPIKGKLFSYDEALIIEEATNSVAEGCKEIWLTAQDTGAYGLDIGSSLPKLLKKILSLDGDFKVRLGMANPNFIFRYLDEMVELLKHPKMFKFLHIPVQAGSDRVLWMMKRPYNSSQYRKIVAKLKEAHPDLTVSTDIIVGFPTESQEEFMESVKLITDTKPGVLNLSKYWPRPGTEAAALKLIEGDTMKERSAKIKEAFDEAALENNKKWIGWEGDVLIDEEGKNKTFIGRNYAYKPVIVKGKLKIGDSVKVKIKKATTHDLRA